MGSGSFGDVVLAEDTKGNKVAIKEVKYNPKYPELTMTLERETFLQQCEHENIVKFIDYFQSENSIIEKFEIHDLQCNTSKEPKFIEKVQERKREKGTRQTYYILIIEYCDYEYCDLEKYIQSKQKPLSRDEILHFLKDIAQGLYYLHKEKRVVHRDLKPSNLMLKSNGEGNLPTVKISDLGFARKYTNEMDSLDGTKIYQAPEILRQRYDVKSPHKATTKYSPKCDLYSVGVILYYMATNNYPFSNQTNIFLTCIRKKTPCQIPIYVDIDEYLEKLILGLVTHESETRLSWEQFFENEFVQEAMDIDKNRMDIEIVENDENLESLND